MRRLWDSIKRLHADERGAEGLEKLLIIAAIVLPLLGVLLVFRDKISEWSSNMYNQIRGQGGTPPPTP